MVRQPTVKGKAVGKLAFDVLKLLPADAERVEMTCDLIRWSHALQNDATRLCRVARAALRDHCARLGGGLADRQ